MPQVSDRCLSRRTTAAHRFLVALALALSSVLVFPAGVTAKNRVITVVNNCDYTVWPAIFRSVGPLPKQKTGWEAKPGSRVGFEVEESWGGRVWGRTGCDFTKDVPEYMMCETGGCNGGLECNPGNGTGKLPVTLAEFNIQTEVDHYDTSNVDGFNIPMAVTNDADCPLSNCPYDLRKACPDKLQHKNEAGEVVGCLTDCGAEQQNEEYCCFGAHQLPENCPSSAIPNYPWWKKNCPIAYAYAASPSFPFAFSLLAPNFFRADSAPSGHTFQYDESSETALFTCTKQVNWMITFCPGPELYSSTALLPNGTEITQGGDYPDYPKGTAKDGGGAPSKPENSEGSDKPAGDDDAAGGDGSSDKPTSPPAATASSGGGGGGGGGTSGGSSGGGGGGETGGGGSGGNNASPSASGGGGGSGGSTPSSSSTSGSSSSGGSTSGSSSSSSSSDNNADDDMLFGLPKTTVYVAAGVLACLVVGLVVYLATQRGGGGGGGKKRKKKMTKSSHVSSSSSDDEDAGRRRGGTTTESEESGSDDYDDDDSDSDGRRGRKSRSARSLAHALSSSSSSSRRTTTMRNVADEGTMRAGLYRDAARRAGGLTALLKRGEGGGAGGRGGGAGSDDARRSFSFGKRSSYSSEEEDRATSERRSLARGTS